MKVYISSTFEDLKEYREAAYRILRKSRHDVISMEDYVAGDARPLDQCLQDVADSDVYVGIFAWRYGFVPTRDNPEARSITELEYRKAVELDKDILIFLLKQHVPWPPGFMDSHTGRGDGGKRIQALRDELGDSHLRSEFENPDELASLVSAAVHGAFMRAQKVEEQVARLGGAGDPGAVPSGPSLRADSRSVDWWRRALEVSRAVVKVTDQSGQGLGTGFVMAGEDLHPSWGPEPVVVTASYVIGTRDPLAVTLPPDEAGILFAGIEGDEIVYRPGELLWESPPNELSTTVFRIEGHTPRVGPLRPAERMPPLDSYPPQQAFLIGYPLGGAMGFSIEDSMIIDYDDRLVHYRTPSEPGTGGGPVFDGNWDVIAVHYSQSEQMPRLDGTGTYPARAGIRIAAIQEAIRADLGDE